MTQDALLLPYSYTQCDSASPGTMWRHWGISSTPSFYGPYHQYQGMLLCVKVHGEQQRTVWGDNSCFCPQLNMADSTRLPGPRCCFSILHLMAAKGHWTHCPALADRGFYHVSPKELLFHAKCMVKWSEWKNTAGFMYINTHAHTHTHIHIYGKNSINRILVLKMTPSMLF